MSGRGAGGVGEISCYSARADVITEASVDRSAVVFPLWKHARGSRTTRATRWRRVWCTRTLGGVVRALPGRGEARPGIQARPGRLKQGQRDVAAFQTLRRMTFACAADAQQALTTLTPSLQAPSSMTSPCRPPTLCHAWTTTPGRPTIAGALASSLATRSPLVDQQRCCILATHERDETQVSPTAL